jgi:hypothetical protein
MRSHGPRAAETWPLIDVGSALAGLATAVKQRGEYVNPTIQVGRRTCMYATCSGRKRIVGHALSLAQVNDEGLEALRGHCVRELYARGQLPVRLTLGHGLGAATQSVALPSAHRAEPADTAGGRRTT